MPKNGHLKWKAVYKPGKVVATGYKNGKRLLTQTIETTKPASRLAVKADRQTIAADGRDVAVVSLEVQDAKGRLVPDACPTITIRLEGDARILGAGNGDPAYLGEDHPKTRNCREFSIPAFNGLAQVLVQSSTSPSAIVVKCASDGLQQATLSLTSK
jgi:beta-galactosidase